MLSSFFDRIRLPFRKDKELYLSLYEIIGFLPHNIELYKTALLHKSIARRNEKGKPVNNERLEFLGDAILDAVVGDIVFQHFPGKREGFLTNTRSKLVQRETLGRLAKEMGIDKLILSNGQMQSHNSYMGGNAFEALVGAIYLDRGYDACMRFMKKRILAQMINIDKVAYKEVNFKSKLIEWTQKNRVKMDFRLLGQDKDKNGNPVFNYQVIIEGVEGCAAKGYSKKESQQLASKLTLEQLRKKPQFIDAVFAAKTDRTKMEEEPTMAVPLTDVQEDFIIPQHPVEEQQPVAAEPKPVAAEPKAEPAPKRQRKQAPKGETAQPADEKKPAKKAQEPKKVQEPKKAQPAKVQNEPNPEPSNASNRREATKEPRKKEPKAPKDSSNSNSTSKPSSALAQASDAAKTKEQPKRQRTPRQAKAPQQAQPLQKVQPEAAADTDNDEFDLSGISAREQSREEIIAAAEAAAFAGE